MNKVCLMTSVRSPFDHRIFYKQAKSLAGAGYEVTVVAPHTACEVVDGIKIKAVRKERNKLKRMLLTTFRIFMAGIREKADIYHFHDPELIPAGLALRLTGRKVIYDVREYYALKFEVKSEIPACLRSSVAYAFDHLETLASRFFNGVIVVDRVIGCKFHNRATRITNYPYLPAEAAEVRREPDGVFRFVYAGGLEGVRGLFKMVEAMEYVDSRARLILIGPYYREEDRLKAEALKGYKKVDWLGFLPWPEVVKMLPGFDLGLVLLQPTRAYVKQGEGTIKLFEYMMSGLPVLGSDFSNFEKIIDGAGCGATVDPTDPREIAKKMTSFMDDPEAARQMGENGKKAFAEKYNWTKESEKLLGLYEKILQKTREKVKA